MSNLRNETKILHLPKAQRNQALAAFVNLNHLNKNYFFSGLKYLSSKSQSVFQPQDNNQSSVFKTFLALGSVVIVPFPRKCKWDDFEVLEYGSPHVFIFKIVGIFLSGGQFGHVVVPNYPVARV